MIAVKWIALWGVAAIGAAILAAIVAGVKRRDHSVWAAWCFVFPPLVLLLVLLPTNKGLRPRQPPMDDDHEMA